MYDGTINLSPEFDDVVLAGPYPKAAGHTTYDECGNTKGNEFDGCNTNTVYESSLADRGELGVSGKAAKGLKERQTT